MRTRLTIAGISVAVVTGVVIAGGVALAAEDNPSRGGTTTPVSTRIDDKGGLRGGNGADDPAGHDAGDDKGGLRGGNGADDPAGHDAGDDKGGQRGGNGADDPAGHDAGDDKGGQRKGR